MDLLRSSADSEERLKALKWVVHLVGDVHQPLHAAFSDDKGGNLFQIQAFGRGGNLHSLWGSGVISNWPGGSSMLRTELMRAGEMDTELSPRKWAAESCKIVNEDGFYPDGRFIDEGYLTRWQPVLRDRLKLAAWRLASVLEAAFK